MRGPVAYLPHVTGGPPWRQVGRLEPHAVAEALNRQTGLRLTVEGLCRGGQVGAAYVRWPDGHRSVLKFRPGASRSDVVAGPVAVGEALRRRGYPAARVEAVEQVADGVVTVLEQLPGSTLDHVDMSMLRQLLALNEQQGQALAGLDTIPGWALHLTEDGPGFCLHQPLRLYSDRSARLLEWITTVGERSPTVLSGDDAVHGDFQPENVLASRGSVTGVVDWDGAARGDRRFDLITLRFGISVSHAEPDVVAAMDAILDDLPTEILRPGWAHMSLRMVDWAIRHFTTHEVNHWLDLAEERAWM